MHAITTTALSATSWIHAKDPAILPAIAFAASVELSLQEKRQIIP